MECRVPSRRRPSFRAGRSAGSLTSASLLTFVVIVQVIATDAIRKPNIRDISQMNFLELCKEFKQNCTDYEVITEDGFMLTVHRIRGDERKPVLLWHGFFDSSESFILRGPDSTGFALAAAGYDVWVGNSRGNKYSRKHINLNPDRHKEIFWDFSVHKMGVYDMAAIINYMLYKTNQKKIAAIGHAQATTMFYILASTKPIYNELVQPFISMAPIAYLTNVKQPLRNLLNRWPPVKSVLKNSGIYEILRDHTDAIKFIQKFCTDEFLGKDLCTDDLVMSIAGNDTGEIEPDFFRVIAGHYPAGTSVEDIDHYVQIFNRKRFSQYDYGNAGNLEKYGAVSPPDYDLKNVTTRVALLCGASDRVSTLEDVALLRAALPNVVHYQVLDRRNHIDFVWGKNINVYLNPLLKMLLSKYA